ncbi:MAG: OmpA family protein [Ignavibacteriaceae bacterium]|nr:OmpA family protein [Ignavibacteriaceae bacterium]
MKNDAFLDGEESPFSESGEKDRYLLTYSDLITLLLGLFIILYAISKIDVDKYQKMMTAMGDVFGSHGKVVSMKSSGNGSSSGNEGHLKNELSQLIDKYHYNNSIRLEENERGVTIHILDDILFPSGSSELATYSVTILNRLAGILKELPNDIRIEGHTDNVPINTASFPSNWHLSVARALNTAYYLINSEGLNPEKVSIVGNSEYKPISTNETMEGRASNRRVDIVIIKK